VLAVWHLCLGVGSLLLRLLHLLRFLLLACLSSTSPVNGHLFSPEPPISRVPQITLPPTRIRYFRAVLSAVEHSHTHNKQHTYIHTYTLTLTLSLSLTHSHSLLQHTSGSFLSSEEFSDYEDSGMGLGRGGRGGIGSAYYDSARHASLTVQERGLGGIGIGGIGNVHDSVPLLNLQEQVIETSCYEVCVPLTGTVSCVALTLPLLLLLLCVCVCVLFCFFFSVAYLFYLCSCLFLLLMHTPRNTHQTTHTHAHTHTHTHTH
jgi:hypothetical protein